MYGPLPHTHSPYIPTSQAATVDNFHSFSCSECSSSRWREKKFVEKGPTLGLYPPSLPQKPQGGRLERELHYTETALGEADTSTHQLVIQAPKDPGASLLHPAALLTHLQVLRAATAVTVHLFDIAGHSFQRCNTDACTGVIHVLRLPQTGAIRNMYCAGGQSTLSEVLSSTQLHATCDHDVHAEGPTRPPKIDAAHAQMAGCPRDLIKERESFCVVVPTFIQAILSMASGIPPVTSHKMSASLAWAGACRSNLSCQPLSVECEH
uniref:Uncharacterized protein n=1 Tax=Timema shepardi TaxID=629360 RepID=A0A7R9AXQ2_TIMSH|nr:unnamed protein product [Timema shepardi]